MVTVCVAMEVKRVSNNGLEIGVSRATPPGEKEGSEIGKRSRRLACSVAPEK